MYKLLHLVIFLLSTINNLWLTMYKGWILSRSKNVIVESYDIASIQYSGYINNKDWPFFYQIIFVNFLLRWLDKLRLAHTFQSRSYRTASTNGVAAVCDDWSPWGAEFWVEHWLLTVRLYFALAFWNQTCKTRLVKPVFCDRCFRSFASGLWLTAK